ncbi:MAG: MgtC/SapB family protein [Calditrichaeota bacterium]|nr:MgtC/SapB family protein [Calditrichota bacterium]
MLTNIWQTYGVQIHAFGQVVFAMFLGALIGFNREYFHKPAGLRTHMLVAGAAAMIMILAKISIMQFGDTFNGTGLRYDPVRIFVAVVTGVSFLGAGTIIRQVEGSRIEGLTTAAALLFSAVIGLAVALSQYMLSIFTTVFAILILWILGKTEKSLRRK